jgi:hypothetical protein
MELNDKTSLELLNGLNQLEGRALENFTLYSLSLEEAKFIQFYLANYNAEISDSPNISRYDLNISRKEGKQSGN